MERWQADEAETDDDTTEFATLDAALTQLF